MSAPCELKSYPDHIAVILHPASEQSSWSDVEAFGIDVRQELERRQRPACVIDLSPLNYMSSSMVALLVRLWKDLQSRQGQMAIVCSNPMVLEVLRIAGLDKLWKITPELAAAERHLGVKSPVTVDAQTAPRSSRHGGMLYFTLGIVTVLIALMVVLLITSRQ